MKFTHSIKLIMLNVLIVGGLMGMPMHAHADSGDGGGGGILSSSIGSVTVSGAVINGDVQPTTDELVNEDSEDEEESAGSTSSPEYKYVSVRRY